MVITGTMYSTLQNTHLIAFSNLHSDPIRLILSLSVQFSGSVMSNSLWSHGLQHARLLCPSPTPGAYSNSCPLHWWCHPTISTSIVPFSSLFNLSQHQGLCQKVCSSHQVAKVLDFQLHHHPHFIRRKWILRKL